MLETLDYTIRIGSTPTFLYFDLYLYSTDAAHYVYLNLRLLIILLHLPFKANLKHVFFHLNYTVSFLYPIWTAFIFSSYIFPFVLIFFYLS